MGAKDLLKGKVVIDHIGQYVMARRYEGAYHSEHIVTGVCNSGLYLTPLKVEGKFVSLRHPVWERTFLVYNADLGRNVVVLL